MEKRVSFYSGPGLKLVAILENPAQRKSRKPGIVLCNGPGGGKDGLVDQVSHWFARAGYMVLRFDYRGIGESEGLRNRLIPLEQVEDARNALTFLQQQDGVDPECLGLWGAATGGANVSYLSGVDNRVKCMVSVNGMGDLGRWFRTIRRYWEWLEFIKRLEADRVNRVKTGKSELVETREIITRDPATQHYVEAAQKLLPKRTAYKSYLTLESAEAMMAFKPELVVGRIAPRASMWICASLDTLVPNEQSITMYENAQEPKNLLIIEAEAEDQHHALYSGKPFEQMMTASTDWFDAYLKKA
jgi:hypothetical protein